MFQRILLAWFADQPPRRSLAVARSLAAGYEAELVIGCASGHEPAEPETVERIGGEGARGVVAHAHAHGFDLIVAGSHAGRGRFVQELIAAAQVPVLVVAEAER
jgi:nucleotide-binding universal stress UspA family protein